MTHATLFVPRCCQCCVKLNPCIRCVLQETQRQCSSIKIALILNKHPVAEIVESQPRADAAEVKPQRFSCVRTLVCVLSAEALLSFRVLHKICRFFFFFFPLLARCMHIQEAILPRAYSMLECIYKGKKIAIYFLLQSKTKNYVAAVVLYFAVLFIDYSLKIYLRWLIIDLGAFWAFGVMMSCHKLVILSYLQYWSVEECLDSSVFEQVGHKKDSLC